LARAAVSRSKRQAFGVHVATGAREVNKHEQAEDKREVAEVYADRNVGTCCTLLVWVFGAIYVVQNDMAFELTSVASNA